MKLILYFLRMRIKKLLDHKGLWLALGVLYVGIITALSLARLILNPLLHEIPNSDKVGHAIAYFCFVLVWFIYFYFAKDKTWTFTKSCAVAFAFAFGYGILMELAQGSLTTYRSPDFMDIIANTSGAILAVAVVLASKEKLATLKTSI